MGLARVALPLVAGCALDELPDGWPTADRVQIESEK